MIPVKDSHGNKAKMIVISAAGTKYLSCAFDKVVGNSAFIAVHYWPPIVAFGLPSLQPPTPSLCWV